MVDAGDLKSLASNGVWVQVPPRVLAVIESWASTRSRALNIFLTHVRARWLIKILGCLALLPDCVFPQVM